MIEHQQHQNEPQHHPDQGPFVPIFVNRIEREIHRGRGSVVQIKIAGEVPLADELSQIIDNKLVELADDASVTIKGNEQFISNPRTGRSS